MKKMGSDVTGRCRRTELLFHRDERPDCDPDDGA
jgi:hypothetical protein